MVLIFYGFIISLMLLNTVSKRKNENFLWIIALIVVWFLCVFVNDNYVDWEAYQGIFNKSTTLYYTKDIGFGMLCYLLNKLGFEAISLRIVIYTVGFALLHVSLKKLNVNKLLFIAFYAYYPLASDAMHLRTCIVSFIFIYAITSYITDKNLVKYVLLISFAVLFHKMAILYLAMVFINKIQENNKFTKRFFVVLGLLVVLLGSNQSLINWLSAFLINVSESVELGSLTNSVGAGIERGWIIDWGLQLMFLVILFGIRHYFRINCLNNKHPTNMIFWVNVIALIFLPLYFISFDYFRMFRNMLAIDYMAFCLYIQAFPTKGIRIISKRKAVAIIITGALVVLTGYMKVGYRGRSPQEFYNFFYNDHISIIEYNGEEW